MFVWINELKAVLVPFMGQEDPLEKGQSTHSSILSLPQLAKNLPEMWRPEFDPWIGKIPWRRSWQPTPVSLPGEPPWTEEPGRATVYGVTKS